MNTNIVEVRKKLVDTIMTRLGGNEMDLDISPETVDKCIDLAIAKLKQRSDSPLEESLILLTLVKNQKEYILPNEIVSIQKIYRKGFSRFYGNSDNFDPFWYSGWSNIFTCGMLNSGRVGGLTTYGLSVDYLQTCAKMFCAYPNYSFNANTHKLVLVENPRTDNEVILLHSYIDKPDYMLIQDRYAGLWIQNWALAETKEILGQLRERFSSGLPSPMAGSVNQNGSQLKSEAKAEKELLEKELMHFTTDGDLQNPCILHG